MAFRIDNQTINDLNIFGDKTGNDIYGLFNKTNTRGAAEILREMFMYPLSNKSEIANRLNTIRFFAHKGLEFPFKNHLFDTIEFYLSNTDERTRLSAHEDTLKRKFNTVIGADNDYQQIKKGVVETLEFLFILKRLILTLNLEESNIDFYNNVLEVSGLVGSSAFSFLKNDATPGKLSYLETVEYDTLLRFSIRSKIKQLLLFAYKLDLYITIGGIAEEYGFCFPEIEEATSNRIEMEGVFHPLVNGAVANDLLITEESNMLFLTGANMAGKSTFMKTFSIAVYLAHVGFPVPAQKMRFSIQDGMFTTINLSDNINQGYSHFYAEVRRLQKVAESVKNSSRLIVVFDELFRGTNVKDAYDATVAVAAAFADKRSCTFIISTHIIEAGETLKKLKDNIRFIFLPTNMDGNKPVYTYKITEGISSDRHGMVIIRNENILDILKVE